MADITITNQTDEVVRKFGEEISPNGSRDYPSDVVLAYSAMEIARALRYINIKLGNIDRRLERDELWGSNGIKRNQQQYVYIQNFDDAPVHDPWIVRKYNDWKRKRKFKKETKELRKKWAKNPPNVI